MHNFKLVNNILQISKDAGEEILSIYKSGAFEIESKNDSSPLTKADKVSNEIICESLKKLNPDIPIISEENCDVTFSERVNWERYWLIDPLDGTKEFIKKNGEFTVNIALIENGKATMGIIFAPVCNQYFWGDEKLGSYSSTDLKEFKKISISKRESKIKILCSRSHPSNELEEFLSTYDDYEIIKKGSSLKFCLIANGTADIYPRFGPTSEWDIAAGSAVLRYAGGSIKTLQGEELLFNKKDSYINEYFIASNL
tara:strand:- start:1154 stop:1918 length:765 start_codon:yes stop_codon:yes gene_type:complete